MTPLEEIIREVVKLRALVVREMPNVRDETFRLDDPRDVNTMRYMLGFVRGCLAEMSTATEDQLVHVAAHHANCVEQAQMAGDESAELEALIALPKPPVDESAANDDDDDDDTETTGDESDGNPPHRH